MSGTTGVVQTDAQLLVTFEDGQPAGSITPQDLRNLIVSKPSPTSAAAGDLMLPSQLAWNLIWEDDFASLSLREGGPTPAGYTAGVGTWTDCGAWYRDGVSTAYVAGMADFGHGYFVDHAWSGWPSSYHPLGQLRLTQPSILQLLISPQSSDILALGESWLIDSVANSGSQLITATPDSGSWSNNGSTYTSGTSVDSLPVPAIISCTNNYSGLQYYNSSPLTVGAALSCKVQFNFGAVNSLMIFVDDGGGYNAEIIVTPSGGTLAGGTATGVITGMALATVSSHQEFTFTWTPLGSGGWTFRIGTGSNTAGSVTVYNATVTAGAQPQLNKNLSALLTAANSFNVQPPFRISFRANFSSSDKSFGAVWMTGIAASAANQYAIGFERDLMETFNTSESSMNQMVSTVHYNTAAVAGNTYQSTSGANASQGFAVIGNWAEFDCIATATASYFYINNVLSSTVPNPGGGALPLQAMTALIDAAFGFNWLNHPGDVIGDTILYVDYVKVWVPSSNTNYTVPPQPPVPALVWSNTYPGGVVPHTTTSGTKIGTLSGAQTYSLVYRGSAPPFAISGTNLTVSGTLTAGTYTLHVKGYAPNGTPAFMPDAVVTVT